MIFSISRGVRAGAITNVHIKDDADVDVHSAGQNMDKIPKNRSIASRAISTGNFSKFLAKIAHCYAAAKFGINGFEPWLTEHILSETQGFNSHLVGVVTQAPLPPLLHRLDVKIVDAETSRFPGFPRSSQRLVVVYIDLFATFPLPTYEVIAGVLPRALHTTSG